MQRNCSQWRKLIALRAYKSTNTRANTYDIHLALAALKSCTITNSLELGQRIHSDTTKAGQLDTYLSNTLINMYSKCGSLQKARDLFEEMPERNVVSWTALMLGYVHNGESKLALEWFGKMQQEGFAPDGRAYVGALMCCTSLRENGEHIHSQVKQTGWDSDMFVASTLVDMYSKRGCILQAREVFDAMTDKDSVAWNALIVGYAENGEAQSAMELFSLMLLQKECTPTSRTFVAALGACGSLESVMHVHSEAAKRSYDGDLFVANTLVDAYANYGRLLDARKVFDGMPYRNVVSWTALILGYAENGEYQLALCLFWSMPSQGCVPNARTHVAALTACSGLVETDKRMSFEQGAAIHLQASEAGFSHDLYVASALVNMYAKCGSLDEARTVFEGMETRDIVSWNSLVLGYAENGEEQLALHLFEGVRGCSRDSRTFVAGLTACTNLATKEEGKVVCDKLVKVVSLEKGMGIHSLSMECGCNTNLFVANTLLDMYMKCGSVSDARRVFDNMSRTDVVSWNALMLGYVENGEPRVALSLFGFLLVEGLALESRTFLALVKACGAIAQLEIGRVFHSEASGCGFLSNLFLSNAFVDMYVKCGSLTDARGVFDSILDRSTVSWNTLLLGYAESGEGGCALEMFLRMQEEGHQPDPRTYVAVLMGCAGLGDLQSGKRIHAEVCRRFPDFQIDEYMVNSLVDFYGKCGSTSWAEHVVCSAPRVGLVTWNALLSGYASHGDAGCVFHVFDRLECEVKADSVSFLAVLNACSHGGLVGEGKEFFDRMCERRFEPAIEHYHCVIDMLGRGNRLEEAVSVVKSMPYEANVVTWQTLLGSCWKWKNVEVAKYAFDKLVEINGNDASAYVLMANISQTQQSINA